MVQIDKTFNRTAYLSKKISLSPLKLGFSSSVESALVESEVDISIEKKQNHGVSHDGEFWKVSFKNVIFNGVDYAWAELTFKRDSVGCLRLKSVERYHAKAA
ncbi:hypothetical protein [Vibrio mediterranei]|uniref:hypothetical protein n=1 Tax=Vibrio mediterranei TaxID=689 RepID=UPI004069167A